MEFRNKAFIEWATEREAVRKAREAGLPREQWTKNPLLRDFRFCNVSREDDRGTIVVKKYIRDPMVKAGADPQELFRALAVARFFNLPSTIIDLVNRGAITDTRVDMISVHRLVLERIRRGETVFSSAYLVGCPPGQLVSPFTEDGGKVSYVCSIVTRATMPRDHTTRRGFVHALRKEAGFKDFMAGQIAADLAYTPILADATDHQTWAPFGPGAVRGMNLAMGRHVDHRMEEREYLSIGIAQMEALPIDMVVDRNLTLHDVASNVNCETFKYVRLQTSGSAGSRRFKSPTGKMEDI